MTFRSNVKRGFFNKRAQFWHFLTFFSIILSSLIALIVPTILSSTIESTDQAANSLLIQQAKNLSLLTGNYSRIGFFHPGPAILYVLAAGEWLFYDILHAVEYPIQGQIIAAAIYTAFWLSLTWHIVCRLFHSVFLGCCLIAIYTCVLSYSEPSIFNSLWFPFLYTLPFGCFVVALAGVLTLDSVCCLYLALAAGFLINGHASFIGITSIAIMISCVIQALIYIFRKQGNLIFGRKNVVFYTISCFVLACFFIPLFLRELLFHEGVVNAYISFARQGQSHDVANSLSYLFQRLGSSFAERLLFVMATIVCVFNIKKSSIGVIILSAASATISTYYYVVHGVDDLHMQYLVIFFLTIPALIVSTSILVLMMRFENFYALASISALAVLTTFWQIYVVSIGTRYSEPEIKEIDAAISQHFISNVALNISDAHDVSLVWPLMVGEELYRLRNNEDMRFCINYNWWILYRKQEKCRDFERPTYLVEKDSAVMHPLPSGAFAAGSLAFIPVIRPTLAPGDVSSLALDFDHAISELAGGWLLARGDTIWSTGPESFLQFYVTPTVKSLTIRLEAFLPTQHSSRDMFISVNGEPSAFVTFDDAHHIRDLEVPLPVNHAAQIDVMLRMSPKIWPADLGLPEDQRKLGVKFSSAIAN